MNNNLKILYNDLDVFSGIAPTPFVSISEDFIDFGTQWNQITNFTLNGQITGKYLGAFSFEALNENAKILLSRFSQNFKSFKVVENSNTLYESPVSIIESINFEESSMYGILPFSMQIKIYDSGLFPNYYGVVEPEERFSFSENDGKIVNLIHTISAKGIITGNQNAIQNAKEWVSLRTGQIDKISPIFLQNNDNTFILESTNETIDRFNGTYSVENSYVKSIHEESLSNCFLNYAVDLNSGITDPFVQVNVNGSLEKNSLNILRQEYNQLDLFNIANKNCNSIFKESLSSRPIAQSVEELLNENKLTFSVSYNNDFNSEIINDYTVDIQTDALTCISTVNFNSQISCKYGDIQTRWQKVSQYYETKFFPFFIAETEYKNSFPNSQLNTNPISESIKFDEINANITYTAQYDDKQIVNQDLISLSCNVGLSPSLVIYSPNTAAFVAREHNIQNLDIANRTQLKIDVTSIAKIDKTISTAQTAAESQISLIKNIYIGNKTSLLEDRKITIDNNINSVQISETYTYEGDILL